MRRPFLKNKSSNRWDISEKMFFSLFLTGAVIEFSQVGAGFVDGLVISRFLGAADMAAEGLAHPIYSILGVFSGLLAVGMQVRCSQAIGRGNRDELSRFFSATVYVGTVVSLAVMAVVLCFSRPFAALLGARGDAQSLLGPTSRYLIGIGIGIPPLIMTAILAPAFQLDSGRKTVQTGALIETAVNILLDIAAVKMGMGIFGVGLATAIASYCNLLYQCTHFLKKDRMLHLVRPNIPVREFLSMLVNGSEKAVKRLANTVRPIVLNAIIIAYGGTAAMSALSVRNNFSNFAEITGAGLANAVGLLVGLYYGEVNEEAIEQVHSYYHKQIAYFVGSVSVLMLVFSRALAGLYVTEGGEIMDMTVFAIRMLALQLPLQALIASRIKYLQSVHLKHNMNLLIFATQLVFVLLSTYILGLLFGVYGILACYTVSDALSLLSILIYYRIRSHKFSWPSRKDLLNLPKEYYIHPGDVISFDIRSIEDAVLASEQIMLFCKGHGLEHKTGYRAALAFEELAVNIVEHGFPNNKSVCPTIDFRAVITGDAFVIRLRDNCPYYNLTDHIAEVNAPDADRTRNVGIRIVSRTAEEISYLHTFETNTLILRFKV